MAIVKNSNDPFLGWYGRKQTKCQTKPFLMVSLTHQILHCSVNCTVRKLDCTTCTKISKLVFTCEVHKTCTMYLHHQITHVCILGMYTNTTILHMYKLCYSVHMEGRSIPWQVSSLHAGLW